MLVTSVVPPGEAEKKQFTWSILEDEGDSRRIMFWRRAWGKDYLCMYPRATRIYPYPPEANVSDLLARFKRDIGWKGNGGDDITGRIGDDIFLRYHRFGEDIQLTFEVRAVVRNKVVTLISRDWGAEKADDLQYPECIDHFLEKTTEIESYEDKVAAVPKPTDGPSMTYELLEEEQDRKVKVTFQRLEAGQVASEYSQIFDMKDPSSMAEVNRYMGQVLFYCTKIESF